MAIRLQLVKYKKKKNRKRWRRILIRHKRGQLEKLRIRGLNHNSKHTYMYKDKHNHKVRKHNNMVVVCEPRNNVTLKRKR